MYSSSFRGGGCIFAKRRALMNTLISVNVGLPREVAWQGKIVRTAVWKQSVIGRVMARRLNLDGDGQAILPAMEVNTAP
jgi:hypothetical protein